MRHVISSIHHGTHRGRHEEQIVVAFCSLKFCIFLFVGDRFDALLEGQDIPHNLFNSKYVGLSQMAGISDKEVLHEMPEPNENESRSMLRRNPSTLGKNDLPLLFLRERGRDEVVTLPKFCVEIYYMGFRFTSLMVNAVITLCGINQHMVQHNYKSMSHMSHGSIQKMYRSTPHFDTNAM